MTAHVLPFRRPVPAPYRPAPSPVGLTVTSDPALPIEVHHLAATGKIRRDLAAAINRALVCLDGEVYEARIGAIIGIADETTHDGDAAWALMCVLRQVAPNFTLGWLSDLLRLSREAAALHGQEDRREEVLNLRAEMRTIAAWMATEPGPGAA